MKLQVVMYLDQGFGLEGKGVAQLECQLAGEGEFLKDPDATD